MPYSTRQIVKDTQTTSTVTSGLLKPFQAKKFLQQTFDSSVLGSLVSRETRTERTGEIDKIGIDRRILRKKIENTDDGKRQGMNFSKLEYACKSLRLPWEITEETFRENIEGENYENIVAGMMTKQVGLDSIDLCLNGDESIDSSVETQDADFLKIDTGWIKQASTLGHVVDNAKKNVSVDMWFDMLAAMPTKYNTGNLRWICNPLTIQQWQKKLANGDFNNGSTIGDAFRKAPGDIEFIKEPMFPKDSIMLCDPKNLHIVNTYNVKIRKDATSKEAIMQDKRFYVIHFDMDSIIEEPDAVVLLNNLNLKA